MEDSRKTLTAGEIEELKEEIRTMPHKEFFGENLQPLAEDHSRLLSILTQPPDAAVREAVEFSAEARCGRLARGILRIGKKLRVMRADMASQTDALIAAMYAINDAGILMPDEVLNYVSTERAVQAPRLTPEQAEAGLEFYQGLAKELHDHEVACIVRAEAAEARVMEWAQGRCGACEHEGSEDDTCYNCQSDDEQYNWTPPQAWKVGE